MKAVRCVGCVALAVLLTVTVVNLYAASDKREDGQTPQKSVSQSVSNESISKTQAKPVVDGCSNVNAKEELTEPGQKPLNQREPRCCGQCTTSDGKSGCTIKKSDGTTYCSAC
jgi:hypothetical protein